VCLNEAKASHSHKTFTDVSFSVTHKIQVIRAAPFPESSFICHSEVPVNKPSPGSPTGIAMERVASLQGHLYMSFIIPHKISLVRFFSFLKGPKKEASLHVPQTMGPLWKQTSTSRALYSIPFRVPSKGALPLSFPHRASS
jgi:hypothetical protein